LGISRCPSMDCINPGSSLVYIASLHAVISFRPSFWSINHSSSVDLTSA
jgi:hypothetical protein